MTVIVKNTKCEEWNKLLYNSNKTSIYHTPQWKKFLEKTFDYEPKYLFAEDESGNLTGLLPLFYVKSKLTANRLCSVPFSHFCGCLGSEDSRDALLSEALNMYSKLNASYFEIRDSVEGLPHQNSFSTYILGLSSDIAETWNKLDKGSVRRAITKSKKMKIEVNSSKDIDDLKDFYELNCINKRDSGVPCHPWKFLKNMFEFLDGNVSLYTAKYNDMIVAGGVFLYFSDTVIYGYGASHPDYLNFYPNNAFIWKSIEDACANGYKYFDFGRVSYDNKGLIQFKKRWGTVETKLYYSYYPQIPETLSGNRETLIYKLATSTVQKMPSLIYKKFSDDVFECFG
ncbi:lipid II:glycine glycyltransferase FemX [Methanosarcina sp. UBA5]|uniref:lipid II:glycine glycyltransferase FemX n=1 Tax=Methanosarcina sp. UBA5 TaxID=1915593 RepID=UPI0025E84C14|nr:GNAT family N-acetyltransferase [Methanosarcina sp. UBA5]